MVKLHVLLVIHKIYARKVLIVFLFAGKRHPELKVHKCRSTKVPTRFEHWRRRCVMNEGDDIKKRTSSRSCYRTRFQPAAKKIRLVINPANNGLTSRRTS
jgi:hypothetical protein